jgi:outer membrane lipoprotein-sorting protein
MKSAAAVCTGFACAVLGWAFLSPVSAKEEGLAETLFQDEPAAHALYDRMIETMRKAQSLYYEADYWMESQRQKLRETKYRIWLKKPNYFRVETTTGSWDKEFGVLVGDGDNLWLYWPNGRPFFSREDAETYQKTRSNVYMKEPTPLGRHSIGHKIGLLRSGMIFDASTFHGYTDSLQPYVDGVKSLGTENVRDDECDVIEVSIMKHQRSWHLWLSRRDHLPRRLKEVVRVANEIVSHEVHRDVTINTEMAADKFAWKPPEGWKEWRMPSLDDWLLKPGEAAPGFELLSTDGNKIKLSDYRGKVVWFYIWRAG